jgi:hypothetical protein
MWQMFKISAAFTFLTWAFLVVGLFSGTANAHHSFATHYDADNVIEITGTLTEVSLRNPHSFFTLDVTQQDGSVISWEIESQSTSLLRREGIGANTLKVGDTLTVWGPRSRRPELDLLLGTQFFTQGGEEFEVLKSIRSPVPVKAFDSRGLTGIERLTGKWLTHIKGQVVGESTLKLNDAGKQLLTDFDPSNTSAMRCVPPNLPAMLFLPYTYEITLKDNKVRLFQEYQKIDRSAVLDSDAGDSSMPGYGTRKARFEGDELVVESTEFPLLEAGLTSGWEPNGNGYDIPSSENKTFTERYSVNEDGSQLILRYTLNDVAYMVEPYSSEIVFERIPDDTLVADIVCDPETATRSGLNADAENFGKGGRS